MSMQKRIRPQTIEVPQVRRIREEMEQELRAILTWWSQHMVDTTRGGFIGAMDGHGNLKLQADKGVILNTRLLWTFASAGLHTNDALHKQMAHRAYEYLHTHFWDELEGGVFWMVDCEGNPLDTQKQIYGQAFAIYAFVAYYELTRDRMALEKAVELFWLIERYSRDTVRNGYRSAFGKDWCEKQDIRLSEKDANESKIMNTHLHLLEAYTYLFRLHPFAALQDALHNLIELFQQHFCLPIGSLQVYFDDDWNPKGNTISFGHNIESSWLLYEAGEALGVEELRCSLHKLALQLVEAVYEEAIDTDGGIFYEAKPGVGLTDTDKHWWPQAEAVVGFWNAYQLSGDLKYAQAALNCWDFIKTSIKDLHQGEWHWRTTKAGQAVLSENKAGPWKAPYHNSRLCLEMIRRMN
ncbi:MAG: AGE family epimerase/isomerase [Phaeodactylibacter sp.]|nr:AGE family epimerase/isomerase [Phaeodactylibacter sp.]